MRSINLFVYGSLLNKEELKKQNILLKDTCPLVLKGYKREFSQTPSREIYKKSKQAVLTIKKDKNSYINGLLLLNVEKKYLELLDEREKGYFKVKLNNKELFCKYQEIDLKDKEVFVYIGKDELYDKNLDAISSYLELCLQGAKSWSEEFFKDFLKHTYIKEKSLLELGF